MTLYHRIFEANARAFPDRRAVVVNGRRATYGEIDRMAGLVAGALARRGIAPGDRVAIYTETTVEAIAAALGILKAGCVLVTTHHTFGTRKLIHQVKEADARALVAGNADGLGPVFDETDLVVAIAIDRPPARPDDRILAFADVKDRPADFEPPQDDGARDGAGDRAGDGADRLGAIFYTSGSTSNPKGVAVNHSNMVAAFRAVTKYLESSPEDVILSYSHMGSDFGFYNSTMPLLFGGVAVVEREIPERPERIVEVIQEQGVTGLHVLPPLIARLVRAEDLASHAIPTVRYISSTGQPLPAPHIRALREAFPAVDVLSMYGMNECKRIAYLPPREIDRRPDSVGKAIPGVRAYIVGDDGAPVTEPGVVGELAVAGDLVMQGYWKNPELTAQRLRRGLFGEERVFFTGDLFRMDEEGFLYFVSRRDEVFGRFLFKVNPKEIERHIMTHDAVAEVVVVPVPDEAAGKVPKACVVLKKGARATGEEIIRHCADHLDWHMVPVSVAFLDALPRTQTGKTATHGLAGA
jgi:acyl-coenzyme A synthetase/AMP-(fatty) acid ligase